VDLQRIKSDGSKVGIETQANTYTNRVQIHSDIAMDNTGKFVCVWHSTPQDGFNEGTYMRQFVKQESLDCPCVSESVSLSASIPSNVYKSSQVITSEGSISAPNQVVFESEIAIRLVNGFHVAANSFLLATIGDCQEENAIFPHTTSESRTKILAKSSNPNYMEGTTLSVYPNPMYGQTQISFNLPQKSPIMIQLFNQSGQLIRSIRNQEFFDKGVHEIIFDKSQIPEGFYHLILQTNSAQLVQKIVILDSH